MQLLSMAMQKDQEADTDANDVCPSSPNPDQAGQSSTDPVPNVLNVPHSPEDTPSTAPFFTLLQARFPGLSHTASLDHGPVSGSSPIPSYRPRLNGSGTANTSMSSALCNHEFCQAASSAVDSGSASPDVNCNTLMTSCMKTNGAWRPLKGGPQQPVMLDLDAVKTTQAEARVLGRKPPLLITATASEGKEDGSLLQPSAEDGATAEQCVFEPSARACTGSAFEATFNESREKAEMSPKEKTGTFYPSFTGNIDLHVCDLHSKHEQNEADSSTIPAGKDKSSTSAGFSSSADHQGLNNTLQADSTVRNSVDMDVEDIDDTDDGQLPRPCESKSFTPYLPQTTGGVGLAGRDQPSASVEVMSETFPHRASLRINPVSIVEESSALPLSRCPGSSVESTTIHMSPPIWTTFALHSATKNSSLRATFGTPQHVPATANAHTQCLSDSIFSEETGAVIETFSRSLSSKVLRSDSLSKGVPRLRNHSHGISTALRACPTPSKRSPLHCTLRQRHGRRPSSAALKIPDVFLEALLEDECALYAGRLQSFFKDLKGVCDRQESPDPVARTLTEGDDMHFLPICDDSALGYRPAFRDSPFLPCLPV